MIRGEQMKRVLFQALSLATVLAGSGAISSLSASPSLQVNVPFAFVVGGKEFAAGQYRIEQTNAGVVFVQGAGQGVAVLSVPAELNKVGAATALSFTSSQSREYLTGIQVDGEPSRAIPVTSYAERKLTISTR
jgi:hypothetical protein